MDNDVLLIRQKKNLLFDFYGALLTDKQRDVYALSTLDDCSIKEISIEMGITPQAVVDSLKRTNKILEEYEAALGMVEKLQNQSSMLSKINKHLDSLDSLGWPEISAKVADMRSILDNLT